MEALCIVCVPTRETAHERYCGYHVDVEPVLAGTPLARHECEECGTVLNERA